MVIGQAWQKSSKKGLKEYILFIMEVGINLVQIFWATLSAIIWKCVSMNATRHSSNRCNSVHNTPRICKHIRMERQLEQKGADIIGESDPDYFGRGLSINSTETG